MKFTSMTFSGLPGAGKTTILNEISKKTGWKIHHIGGVLRDMHIEWQKKTNSNLSFAEWYSDKNIVSRELIKRLNDEARDLLKKGNIILDSRFGTLNSEGLESCLDIFVTAPLEVRIQRRSLSKNSSQEEVKFDLISRENSEVERGKEFYLDFKGKEDDYDYRNPEKYDLILDTSKMTVEEEIDKIMSLVENKRIITISGQPGSGNTSISKLLASKLNMNFFNVGTLWKDVAKGTISSQFYYSSFRKICEKKKIVLPSLSLNDDSNAANALWNTPLGNSLEFNEAIDELQLELAKKGNVIIEGKLSLFMVKSSDLKVWIKSDFEERAKRTSRRDSLDLEDAKKILFERQEKEREGWKKIYGFDYFEQEKVADLIIDSSNKTTNEAVEEILNILNNKL